MSDNWVGPGWWMASDGKWYPPRTPATMAAFDENQPPTRWSRQTRSDETAPIPHTEVVAPKSPPEQELNVSLDEMVEPPEPITVDVSEQIDLRIESAKDQSTGAAKDKDKDKDKKMVVPIGSSVRHASSSAERKASGTSAAGPVSFAQPASGHEHGDTSEIALPSKDEAPPSAPVPKIADPIRHAVLPAIIERDEPQRSTRGLVLLTLAVALAVLCGLLGALLLRERAEIVDLRDDLAVATATDDVADAGLTELNDEVRTLRLQNDQLQAQLNDATALVLELPEGRVTEIVIPFTPVFADEENGRFIAMGANGDYVVWGEGTDGAITDSGTLSGSPTGLFAAARKAWISTDASRIDVVSLTNEEGLPSVEFGPSAFLAAEDRAYWTYDKTSGDLVRLRKGDGGITATVSIPVPVIDLTIGAGSVWALGDDGRVYQVNTADLTVQAIDAGADLISITAGPDALWTLSAGDGSLRRVDAVSGEVLVTVPVGRDPIDATFAGNSVWVALRSGTSLIEVDTRTSAVISRTALPGIPTALHQGDSGVFVTMEGDVPLVRVASLTTPAPADEAGTDGADETADAG